MALAVDSVLTNTTCGACARRKRSSSRALGYRSSVRVTLTIPISVSIASRRSFRSTSGQIIMPLSISFDTPECRLRPKHGIDNWFLVLVTAPHHLRRKVALLAKLRRTTHMCFACQLLSMTFIDHHFYRSSMDQSDADFEPRIYHGIMRFLLAAFLAACAALFTQP